MAISIEERDKLTESFRNLIKKYMNNFNREDRDELVQIISSEFIKTHLTLQQTTVSVLYDIIKILAKNNYTDLRNQASMELFRKITEMDCHFPFI